MTIFVGPLNWNPRFAPKPKQIIHDLQQQAIEVAIISGDHERPTRQLAQTLGIDRYFAETLPEQKAELVAALQQTGKKSLLCGRWHQ